MFLVNVPFYVDLKDKVAVVTGGGGILGTAFCEALAQCGAKVAIINRTKEKADKVAEKINASGGTALGIFADVLNLESLENAKKIIIENFGTCDILINAAGGNHPKGITSEEYYNKEKLGENHGTTFFDLDPQGVEYVFNLNFLGTLLPSQVFGKDMVGKKGAVIINISSMSAYAPMTKVPAYSGAKAAISNFTQWLAVHMSKVGVRVNAIAPGFFLTEQNRTLLTHADGGYTDRGNKIISQTPMGRLGNPEELIGTLLWLVDDKASGFVNGAIIPVDGGFLAYSGV
jgi:NAD(P)-dependent dehydrogenase (short-subunit alcohol dehydrogenase family)